MTRPVLLVGVARAVSLALGVLVLGLLGRRLGPDGFGTLQFALAVMVYPTILVDLGLTTLGLREIAKGAPSQVVIGRILGARLVLAVGVVIMMVAGILSLPLDPETRAVFSILTLGVAGSAMNARWVLQGERRFERSAFLDVVSTAAQLLASVALVGGTGDVLWAAMALTLATWVTTVVSIVAVGQNDRFRPRIGRELRAVLLRGLPLGAAAVAITLYYSVDTVLLGFFRGAAEVAFYAAAYRILLPALALAGAVGTVAIPHFTFLGGQDAALADQAAANLSRRMILAGLPIAAVGTIAAETIIIFVYGPEFGPAAVPFGILVWSVVTVYANAAFAFLILAREGDRRYLLATAAGAAVNVSLNLVVIPLMGMAGAAVTTILSEITVLGLLLWWTRDVSRSAVVSAIRAAALPTLVMSVVVWPIRGSVLAVPLSAVVYCLISVLTGVMPAAQLIAWWRRLRT